MNLTNSIDVKDDPRRKILITESVWNAMETQARKRHLKHFYRDALVGTYAGEIVDAYLRRDMASEAERFVKDVELAEKASDAFSYPPTLYARPEPTIDNQAAFIMRSEGTPDKKPMDVVLYRDATATDVYCRVMWFSRTKPTRRNKFQNINSVRFALVWIGGDV